MKITRKFRSVTWAAAVASAALSCYLISYRVSAERIALEETESDIAEARDDILALDTEFETRSRMSQLERWNRRDLALVAPDAGQFVEGDIELASLLGHDAPMAASIRNASADRDIPDKMIDEDVFQVADPADSARPHLQQASYLVPPEVDERARAERIAFLDEAVRSTIAAEAAEEVEQEADRH